MISATHLHAMLVHFPISLLIVGFLSELAAFIFKKPFFRQAAFYLLMLGTLGTISSYLAGSDAGEGMEEGTLGKAMELHEQAATIALWLTIFTAAVYLAIAIFKYKKTGQGSQVLFLFADIIRLLLWEQGTSKAAGI
ncbi:MAG: hypothetical protein IPP96_14120 [Chitinophagaceae bacterium]|nr:hypothetical protein [Chitinophagaceae bacterium]